MNSFRLLIILITLFFIIVLSQKNIANKSKGEEFKLKISPLPAKDNKITPTLTPSISKNSIESIISEVPPSSSPQNQDLSQFKYPSSVFIREEDNKLFLESPDNPQVITDWYKEKTKNLGMSAKSFVQTNTNGNILNKLVGSNGKMEIRVEIVKPNNQSEVKISIYFL